MSTAWTSLLPFLAALQRNQNMPDEDDDSNPPVDQFGRVLPSPGNGVAPGASQSNLAQTDALQNYQRQSNWIDNLVGNMAPYPATQTPRVSGTPAPGTPPLLARLLQAAVYPSPPKPGGPGTPQSQPGQNRPGPGTPQSSDPNQAQPTNDDDDSKPPVDPSGLVGLVPGASQSNTQSDAIGDIVRSMTPPPQPGQNRPGPGTPAPGALPVYPPLQQAAAMSSAADPNFVRPPNVEVERQLALQRGQATQPPVSDAQRKAGLVIRVGIRRLLTPAPGDLGHHTYLEIPRLDQDGHPVYDTNGNVVYDSYGVMGQWDDKKGEGTPYNQQVTKNDIHSGKNGLQLRNEPKPGSDNNALYEIAVSPDQLAQLKAGAEYWAQSGHQCPSCGNKNYKPGIPVKDDGGYNSNTWVYNMLIQNPAGAIEPPAEITRKALKSRNEGLGLDIFAPGWSVNDSSKDYYPGPRPELPNQQE